jgi:hypothetical protein
MSDKLDVLIARALTNIDDDRATTEELLSELKDYLSVSKDRYAESGTVAAKLVETLQRSNEQLVKLAAIVHKKEATKSSENLTELDKDELFDIIQSGGE